MISHTELLTTLDSSSIATLINKLPASGLMIAYSGGLDSTVLLHLISTALAGIGVPVRAVHINHGLQQESAQWSKHCIAQCEAMDVDIVCVAVEVSTKKGVSIEAAARTARYGCLANLLRKNEFLLTAHHLDDQAETFLLQALRGSGPQGLSAMPLVTEFSAGFHARPLLGIPRSDLRDYAAKHELTWIDDPSNENSRFDRNYLRLHVLPVIFERWPSARLTLSRSAKHCSDAEEIIAAACKNIIGDSAIGPLDLRFLAATDRPHTCALIRTWIHNNGLPLPSETKIRQVIEEVIPAAEDAEPEVTWSGGEIRRYRDKLYCMSRVPGSSEELHDYSPLQETALPLGGSIQWVESDAGGVALEMLQESGWQLRFRRGGERIRPEGQSCHRELKKLFQEQGVFPWVRNLLPLIFHQNKLIAVADLWLDSDVITGEAGPRLRPVWQHRPQIFAE